MKAKEAGGKVSAVKGVALEAKGTFLHIILYYGRHPTVCFPSPSSIPSTVRRPEAQNWLVDWFEFNPFV